MKNIHLLPTDKYSSLVHSTSKYGGLFKSEYYSPMKEMGDSYQNIYITNSEEIKAGDWIIQSNFEKTNTQIIQCVSKFQVKLANDKDGSFTKNKIILTTDQDLIKDGVQEIDDEFLEWFVKNPSCEVVEVDFDVIVTRTKSLLQNQSGKTIAIPHRIHYRIIIPKEELKQIKCYCGHTTYCDCGPLEEPKQETLEEAMERYLDSPLPHSYKRAVEFGAKWNQEQILQFLYSEITERRPYSSSKMCEKVIEFIEQLNTKK